MSDTPRVAALIERNRSACNLTKYCDMIGLANEVVTELSASRAECQRLRGILEECLTMSSEEADANALEALTHIHSTARAALQEVRP